ncbi:unnamed protein product, partial [Mesorhabditis spiculigera]
MIRMLKDKLDKTQVFSHIMVLKDGDDGGVEAAQRHQEVQPAPPACRLCREEARIMTRKGQRKGHRQRPRQKLLLPRVEQQQAQQPQQVQRDAPPVAVAAAPVPSQLKLKLDGGFNTFQASYPELCESSALPVAGQMATTPFGSGLSSRASLSQPCLPQGQDGPTQILPFLYLGSQHDALSHDTLKKHNITYVLNLSLNCPKADILKDDEHFLRIPVNDNYQEKLLPYFYDAFVYLDKVRERGEVVLIHCLAGISRSPTLAISYIMRHLKMGSDEAYRFVKARRRTISPNFNFMGQLLEYERILVDEGILKEKDARSPSTSSGTSSGPSLSPSPFNDKQDFCPAKVPKSCSSIALFHSLPSSLSGCPSTEETLPPNEHGKRSIASIPALERPCALEGASVAAAPARPMALGLKSRRPVVIPQVLGEELPSPSSELSKLSFASAANPCFVPSQPMAPARPQLAQLEGGHLENPMFSAAGCSSMVPSIPGPPVPQRQFVAPLAQAAPNDLPAPQPEPEVPAEKPEKEPKEFKLFPMFSRKNLRLPTFNMFQHFKKQSDTEDIPRSRTADAGLAFYAQRPDNLSDAGVIREGECPKQRRKGGKKCGNGVPTDSPESGFQDGYKTTPEQDPDRTSIGSASSLEIAVQ